MRLLAVLALGALILAPLSEPARAQAAAQPSKKREFRGTVPKRILRQGQSARPARASRRKKPRASKQPEQPSRPDFTADDQAAAIIPGIPDARFWADSEKDFLAALPATPGPWLALSTGGGDGAFGAGLLNGWSESGKRPEFSVVTGVSTGALMAPYAFVGSSQDAGLKRAYTEYNAGDIFEDVKTPESLVDTWPLRRLIAKEVTARTARAGRRGAQARPPPVRRHHQPRCPARRRLEHGRDRRQGRRGRAQAVPRRARGLDRHSRAVSAGADRRRGERQEDAGDARRRRALRRRYSSRPKSMLNTSSTTKTAGDRALSDRQQPPDAGIPDDRALADLRARPFDRGRRAVDAADEYRPRLRGGEAQRHPVLSLLPGARAPTSRARARSTRNS